MNGIFVGHHEDTSFDRIHYPRRSWSFWHMTAKVFESVILFASASYTVEKTSSTSKQCNNPPWQCNKPQCNLCPEPFAMVEVGDLAKPSILSWFQSTRLWVHSEIEDTAAWEAICKQGRHLNSVLTRGGAHRCITHSWWYSSPSSSLAKICGILGELLWRVLAMSNITFCAYVIKVKQWFLFMHPSMSLNCSLLYQDATFYQHCKEHSIDF